MTATLCEICGGVGFDRQNRVCIHCGGSGRDPYLNAPGGGGPDFSKRSGRAVPLPRSLQAVIFVLAFAGGAISYVSSGGSLEKAGLGFLLLLVTGLVFAHAARNMLTYLILAVAFYGLDQALWEAQALPWALNATVGIVTQVYAEVF